jgi:negative regulator of flagellin synthesis FlgM
MDVTKVGTERVQQDRVSEQTSAQKSQAAEKDATQVGTSSKAKSTSNPSVKWSADAQLMAEGLEVAKSTGDVRADRVAQVKDAIRNGTYKVDAKKIADRMIQESLSDDLSTRNG